MAEDRAIHPQAAQPTGTSGIGGAAAGVRAPSNQSLVGGIPRGGACAGAGVGSAIQNLDLRWRNKSSPASRDQPPGSGERHIFVASVNPQFHDSARGFGNAVSRRIYTSAADSPRNGLAGGDGEGNGCAPRRALRHVGRCGAGAHPRCPPGRAGPRRRPKPPRGAVCLHSRLMTSCSGELPDYFEAVTPGPFGRRGAPTISAGPRGAPPAAEAAAEHDLPSIPV